MINRLNRWFTYNVALALAPLGVSIVVRYSNGNLTLAEMANTPELLFFIVMINATTLGDLNDIGAPLGDNKLKIFQSLLLLGLVFSAIFYGILFHDNLSGQASSIFRIRLFQLTIAFAIICLILSTAVQVIMAKIERGGELALIEKGGRENE